MWERMWSMHWPSMRWPRFPIPMWMICRSLMARGSRHSSRLWRRMAGSGASARSFRPESPLMTIFLLRIPTARGTSSSISMPGLLWSSVITAIWRTITSCWNISPRPFFSIATRVRIRLTKRRVSSGNTALKIWPFKRRAATRASAERSGRSGPSLTGRFFSMPSG